MIRGWQSNQPFRVNQKSYVRRCGSPDDEVIPVPTQSELGVAGAADWICCSAWIGKREHRRESYGELLER